MNRRLLALSIATSLTGWGFLLPLAGFARPLPAAAPQLAQLQPTPIALVDPDQPIQLSVVNAAYVPITCQLTQPASAQRTVAPDGTTSFGSTTTSYLPLPIYFVAYASETNVGLGLDVFVEENVVTIVITSAPNTAPGNGAVTINSEGGVYVY